MKSQPVDIVRRFMQLPPCKTSLSNIVAKDVILVAPEGMLPNQEIELLESRDDDGGLLDTAVALLHCSATRRVTVSSIFGAGNNVAAFGTVTDVMCSGEDVTSPFSLWVKVANGRIVYIQYLDGDSRGNASPQARSA